MEDVDKVALKLLQDLFKNKNISEKTQIYFGTTFLPVLVHLLEVTSQIPFARRTLVVSTFLLYVQLFVDYYVQTGEKGDIFTPSSEPKRIGGTFIPGLNQLFLNIVIQLSSALTDIHPQTVQTQTTQTPTANKIINKVFVEELACDLGKQIQKYRNAGEESIKNKIKQNIEKLLKAYNEVSDQAPLTFEKLLKK